MSGLEVLAVVGCIAAVCSAYADGSELVHNLRKRRAQKRALQAAASEDEEAEHLETSLARGNTTIQSRYDQNFRRLGDVYAQGDEYARDQLKDIIIHLQSAVIINLKYAWREDAAVDFQSLQDTSDESQTRAVLCLIELNKRLLVAAPIVQMPTVSTRPRGFIEPERPDPRHHNTQPLRPSPPRNELGPVQSRQQAPWTQPGDLSTLRSPSRPTPVVEKKKEKRGFSISIGRRKESVETTRPSEASTGRKPSPTTSPIPIPIISREPPPNDPSRDLALSPLEYNPWSDELSTTPPQASRTRASPSSSISTSPSTGPFQHRTSFQSIASTVSSTASSIPRLTSRTTSTSTSTSISTINPLTTTLSPLPGDHNAYRGLCKSAWRLQTQHQKKALQAITLPASSFGTITKRHWGCTECAFRGPLTKDATTGKDAFDDKVYMSRDGRVRFRWLFLFRSHVKVREREPSRFSCVFCAETEPVGALEVFAGGEELVAHIGREHTGEGRWPEGRVLWQMNCAIEGGGGVGEGWDVLLLDPFGR